VIGVKLRVVSDEVELIVFVVPVDEAVQYFDEFMKYDGGIGMFFPAKPVPI
jgi:hypothetical protein